MNQHEMPTCPRFDQLPARLEAKVTGAMLGFPESDIPILVAKGYLKPLGNPAPNAPKYFARDEIERLAHDYDWLNKATRAVAQYWKQKRERLGQKEQGSEE